jgi:hypothetical protein
VSRLAAKRKNETSRRWDEKQGRVFEVGKAVRVVSENGFLVARLDPLRDAEQIRRLLDAPNAAPIEKHDGRLAGIRLLSVGDDRGHSGERHGSSVVTTERVRNDDGILVGSGRTLKHKAENVNHASRPLAWTSHGLRRGPLQAPLAARVPLPKQGRADIHIERTADHRDH